MPKITIRFGATNNNITVDGHRFDLSKTDAAYKRKLSRMVVGGLDKAGYFDRG